MNILDLLPEFSKHLRDERQLKPNTIRCYELDLKQINEHVGGKPLTAIDANDLRLFIRSLNQQGLKARTIRRKLNAASTFYKFQIALGRVEVNVAQRAQAFAPKRRRTLQNKVLTHEQWRRFANTPAGTVRDTVAWGLLAWLGIRNSELRMLRVGHVDLKANTLLIAAAGDCGGGAKADTERRLPIPPSVLPGLTALCWNREPCGFAFRGDNGGIWNKDQFRYAFKDHLLRCELPDAITPHWLRHTVASSLASELDIFQLRDFLGHQSIRTVEEYVLTEPSRLAMMLNHHPLIDG